MALESKVKLSINNQMVFQNVKILKNEFGRRNFTRQW